MEITKNDVIEIIDNAGILVDTNNLLNDINLQEQGVDSLDIVNIYMMLEDKFNIKIPDTDLPNVKTIDDIVSYVNSKI